MYTLAMAKTDYKENWIDSFTLVKRGDEWMLEVSQGDAPAIRRCICTARGDLRMFKTVDSAIKTAEQIGFAVHALRFEAI